MRKQADLNKFSKSVTGLPAKKVQAYNECERLRRASLVYMMPCIRFGPALSFHLLPSRLCESNS